MRLVEGGSTRPPWATIRFGAVSKRQAVVRGEVYMTEGGHQPMSKAVY